jgi:hypothetical protein
LLDRLQNGPHRGKGRAANQSTYRRIGLGTACKKETTRMKNISITRSGEKKKYVLRLRKTVYSQKNSYRYDDVHYIDNDDETVHIIFLHH